MPSPFRRPSRCSDSVRAAARERGSAAVSDSPHPSIAARRSSTSLASSRLSAAIVHPAAIVVGTPRSHVPVCVIPNSRVRRTASAGVMKLLRIPSAAAMNRAESRTGRIARLRRAGVTGRPCCGSRRSPPGRPSECDTVCGFRCSTWLESAPIRIIVYAQIAPCSFTSARVHVCSWESRANRTGHRAVPHCERSQLRSASGRAPLRMYLTAWSSGPASVDCWSFRSSHQRLSSRDLGRRPRPGPESRQSSCRRASNARASRLGPAITECRRESLESRRPPSGFRSSGSMM